jgi:hypothetical protein
MSCGDPDAGSVAGETEVIVGTGVEMTCSTAFSLKVLPALLLTRTTYSPASPAETELTVRVEPVPE